eukprot:6879242-Alexandrium_andersonii.AAC.1
MTLRPGQRSRGEEWLGFWPKWSEPSTPCSGASQPSQAGWSGRRRPNGHLRRAPVKQSRVGSIRPGPSFRPRVAPLAKP